MIGDFRSRPEWSIKDYWVHMREEGYRGVGNRKWWRGYHRWAQGYEDKRLCRKMSKGLGIEIDCS